eukprot:g39671.t1
MSIVSMDCEDWQASTRRAAKARQMLRFNLSRSYPWLLSLYDEGLGSGFRSNRHSGDDDAATHKGGQDIIQHC